MWRSRSSAGSAGRWRPCWPPRCCCSCCSSCCRVMSRWPSLVRIPHQSSGSFGSSPMVTTSPSSFAISLARALRHRSVGTLAHLPDPGLAYRHGAAGEYGDPGLLVLRLPGPAVARSRCAGRHAGRIMARPRGLRDLRSHHLDPAIRQHGADLGRLRLQPALAARHQYDAGRIFLSPARHAGDGAGALRFRLHRPHYPRGDGRGDEHAVYPGGDPARRAISPRRICVMRCAMR